MGKKGILILLFLLISIISVYGTITGMVTLDVPKDLNITLAKAEYSGNEDLDGEFTFTLKAPLKDTTKVTFGLNNQTKEIFLKDLFDEQSISFEIVPSVTTGKTPVLQKKLFFNDPGKQIVYTKLPKGATVSKADMLIRGEQLNTSFPKEISMDVGSDGLLEWLYLGDFISFIGNIISNADFNANPAGSAILDHTGKFHCQLFELGSYTKDMEVNAEYALFDASVTGGDVNASILSPSGTGDSFKAFGGGDRCDLKNPTGINFEKNTCRLTLQRPVKGNYLICVFNAIRGTTPKNYFKLGSTNSNSNKAYVCDSPNPITGETNCNRAADTFYMGIRNANYSNTLNLEVNLSKGYTDRNFERTITDFLASCPGTTDCIVPIEIYSGRGTVNLNSLKILYSKAGLTKEENSFYDVESTESYMGKVDDVDLTTASVNVTIPLSVTEFETPVLRNDKNLDLTISFNPGPVKKATIKVKGISVRKIDILGEVKADLEDFNTNYKEIIDLMGLTGKLDDTSKKITEKEQEIDKVMADTILNDAQKSARRDSILQEITKLREKLPRDIKVKGEIKDIISVSPEDVRAAINGEMNENVIYNLQKNIKIGINAQLYEVSMFDGSTEKKTLITKTIEGSASQGYFVEIIPKSVASDISKITFKEEPEIIQKDPVVKWSYSSLPLDVSYMVDGDIIINAGDIKTVVVPNEIKEESQYRATCGNGVCEFLKVGEKVIPLEDEYTCPQDCKKKIPWLLVVLILLALGIGLGYIYYRKKLPLFKTKVDEENLRRYVQKALDQKYTKEKIDQILLGKGWLQRQIDYVYGQLIGKKK